jgi:hypothetical protein
MYSGYNTQNKNKINGNVWEPHTQGKIVINNNIIEQVTDFKYIGYCISAYKIDLGNKNLKHKRR